MGAIGERKMQEMIDRAAWEVSKGTPPDIASRGLFEACAEAFEDVDAARTRTQEAENEVKEYAQAVRELRDKAGALVGEDEDTSDPDASDLGSVFDLLKTEIDRLTHALVDARDASETQDNELAAAESRIKELGKALHVSEARAAELEKITSDYPAMAERIRYLEDGLGRLIVEAYKLRKGVL
jgi:predicted  nucleic acid-binding Zn-ribbon protein